MSDEIINNPAHYRRMSEPFASAEASNEALTAFFEEVRAARDRHRIGDVVVLCEVSCMTDGGEEMRGAASLKCGDSARVLPILAREFGAAQALHEEQIALIKERARRAARK